MAIVIAVYCFKVVFKIFAGRYMGSVALETDGFHNLSDIAEGLLVIFVIFLGRRPASQKFPLGLASVENIVSFEIGIIVLIIAVTFFIKSGTGFLGWLSLKHELPAILSSISHTEPPVHVSMKASLAGLAVASISIVLSLINSTYQITLGKKLNSPSLISDGKETLSDSMVESCVLFGVVGTMFNAPYLDSLAGLLVSVLIGRIAIELMYNSGKVLLNVSIDREELAQISAVVKETKGIRELVNLYAYTIGKSVFAVAELAVEEHLTFGAVHHMRGPLEAKVKQAVPRVSRVFITFVPEETLWKRYLVGIGKDRGLESLIAEDLLKARHYVILDVNSDRIGRLSIYPNTFESNSARLVEFAKGKKVDVICWSGTQPGLQDGLPAGMELVESTSLTLGDMFSA
mgnify:CR=1 FL=1